MPTLYEDPAAHDLVLVGELEEMYVTEGVFPVKWRIAVWQDPTFERLYYAVEHLPSSRFTNPPFQWVNNVGDLQPILDVRDFQEFKWVLHNQWQARHVPARYMTFEEKRIRNRLGRLQDKVGRRLRRSYGMT